MLSWLVAGGLAGRYAVRHSEGLAVNCVPARAANPPRRPDSGGVTGAAMGRRSICDRIGVYAYRCRENFSRK